MTRSTAAPASSNTWIKAVTSYAEIVPSNPAGLGAVPKKWLRRPWPLMGRSVNSVGQGHTTSVFGSLRHPGARTTSGCNARMDDSLSCTADREEWAGYMLKEYAAIQILPLSGGPPAATLNGVLMTTQPCPLESMVQHHLRPLRLAGRQQPRSAGAAMKNPASAFAGLTTPDADRGKGNRLLADSPHFTPFS